MLSFIWKYSERGQHTCMHMQVPDLIHEIEAPGRAPRANRETSRKAEMEASRADRMKRRADPAAPARQR